ncbi:MAG: glycosyltransferase family 9 protein [Chloroflexi bacterium]|nr:MAG: glycosyltransferase family 9 protein [Chloroflexota bacterium]
MPQRIVLIQPCCIGDVILATATLTALRRGYPTAHIAWAVGSWARAAIENHPLLDAIIDTGTTANPAKNPLKLARQLHGFDLAVSLVRSPWMSVAVLLSGIPQRAGLSSGWRGFGYNIRVSINPYEARHEAQIYLDVPRALGIDVNGCYANVPADLTALNGYSLPARYIVINPCGGQNPGMEMSIKRWLPQNFAALGQRLTTDLNADIILLGGPGDQAIVEAVQTYLDKPARAFIGELSFPQIAALAAQSQLYIGNDTGLTHLAAAAGARTVMILGPSDPARYAPFTPHSLAIWKPTPLKRGGVASGTPENWSWERDGISVEAAYQQIIEWLAHP